MTDIETQLLHLQKDRKLKKVIAKSVLAPVKRDTDLYLGLMRAIVGQQLSVKAAQTIWQRFLNLFPKKYPSAQEVLKLSDEQLRSVGLSYQKASYIRNIAEFSVNQTLDYKKLKNKTDAELIEYLVSIKGVGRWTAEMLLMFNLQREDVFPKDDLGIQNGMKALYGFTAANKKELYLEMEKYSLKWKPFRSLACMHIWSYKDKQLKD